MRYFARFVSLAALMFAFGCGGTAESDGPMPMGQGGEAGAVETPEPSSVLLAQSRGEAPLEACPNGGVLVDLGVGLNANGALDEDEIQRSEAICNGADGAPGRSCAIADNDDGSYTVACPDSGPVTIRDGANGVDGQPGEQGPQGERGTDGEPGTNGQSVAVRQSAETAGENCADGGTKVETGIDTNGDGRLEDDEVSATTYVCNGGDGAPGMDGNDGVDAQSVALLGLLMHDGD